jgi:hypothetical protein
MSREKSQNTKYALDATDYILLMDLHLQSTHKWIEARLHGFHEKDTSFFGSDKNFSCSRRIECKSLLAQHALPVRYSVEIIARVEGVWCPDIDYINRGVDIYFFYSRLSPCIRGFLSLHFLPAASSVGPFGGHLGSDGFFRTSALGPHVRLQCCQESKTSIPSRLSTLRGCRSCLTWRLVQPFFSTIQPG